MLDTAVSIELVALALYEDTIINGGVTARVDGSKPDGGYCVSDRVDLEVILTSLSPDAIAEYIRQNFDVLSQNDRYIGTWYDTDSARYFIDTVLVLNNLEHARRVGQQAEQIAIFDLSTFTEIRL